VSEHLPTPEGEPQLRQVEVEISEYTNEYMPTWRAVYEADTIIGLANRSLAQHGFELVPLWRGHYLHEPEVAGLLDNEGIPHDAEPVPDLKRVSMAMAARAVVTARLEEIGRMGDAVNHMWHMGEIPSFRSYARLKGWMEDRSRQIVTTANRPPEGGEE